MGGSIPDYFAGAVARSVPFNRSLSTTIPTQSNLSTVSVLESQDDAP